MTPWHLQMLHRLSGRFPTARGADTSVDYQGGGKWRGPSAQSRNARSAARQVHDTGLRDWQAASRAFPTRDWTMPHWKQMGQVLPKQAPLKVGRAEPTIYRGVQDWARSMLLKAMQPTAHPLGSRNIRPQD